MMQAACAAMYIRSERRTRTCRFTRRCAPATLSSSGTIEEETRGTIEAIGRILAEEGASLADVVRVTTYLGDARDFGRYNRVFGEMFGQAILARTTVEARAVINTKIEMDAIAYKPRQ